MTRFTELAWLSVAVVAGMILSAPAKAQIAEFYDRPTFNALKGPQADIGFEELPAGASSNPAPGNASMPNPLVESGITIADPSSLATVLYTASQTLPDSRDLYGGNIVLLVDAQSTFTFPAGTQGALFQVEGGGTNGPVFIIVNDLGGAQDVISTTDVAGRFFVGASSTNGIAQVQVFYVPGASLAISSLLVTGFPPPPPGTPPTPPGAKLVLDNNREAEVHWHQAGTQLRSVEMSGEIDLTLGLLPSDVCGLTNRTCTAHATMSLGGKTIADQDITIKLNGNGDGGDGGDNDGWESDERPPTTPGISKLQINWMRVPWFDTQPGTAIKGPYPEPRVVSRFIGPTSTYVEVFRKGLRLPFTVNFDNLASMVFNADGSITTSLCCHQDDDKYGVDVLLPFRMKTGYTIAITGAYTDTITLTENLNFFDSAGQYSVTGRFNLVDPALTTDMDFTSRNLGFFLKLGGSPGTIQVQGRTTVKSTDWTAFTVNHWLYNEDTDDGKR